MPTPWLVRQTHVIKRFIETGVAASYRDVILSDVATVNRLVGIHLKIGVLMANAGMQRERVGDFELPL